ncbi:GntR family transcriptional regulator [Mycobacterium sp. ITM-2016-00317]|uniref:GntR family transcriptional regulator n=1 Tax=Mycobacterium sp. ITM-2016-00317 TaxID=2099694 RepID=UPI000D41532B|nr:GntR family transcriptional regulator [Mycobacterium sp. ITM-2016-00317]WNG87813.1 GntR family transcriptional regulator [Mycobacterium sp. ITM-2016-00317]
MTSHTGGRGESMAIAPITRSTVRDAVKESLRDLIIGGGVPMDVPLRQDELASRLNVSRTPLREALHALASEGLVTIDPRRGAIVSKPTVQQLLDLYEIREQLEVLAARRAVDFGDAAHVEEMEALNDEMAGVTDPAVWARLNQEFHRRLYEPCPNKDLLNLIGSLAVRARFYVGILVSSRSPADGAVHEHAEMLNALRDRAPDAMEAAIRKHLRSTVAHVAPTLTHNSPLTDDI